MKTLIQKFKEVSRLNPFWSSYLCFADVIKTGKYKSREIRKSFNSLVSKKDYDRCDKENVLQFLFNLADPKRK